MIESKQGQKISIIIPLLNEEENISTVYHRTKETLDKLALPYEIIFVDDGSTDNTYQSLKRLELTDERLIIVKFVRNFGQTAALAAGFRMATGDIAITLDGDLQCDPMDIVLFLDAINQGADVVCSWRQANNLYLQILRTPSFIANYFGAFIFGLKVHDISSSFRAYKKGFYKKLYLKEGFHRFIPILAKFEGMVIKEVKIFATLRKRGVSKYTPLRYPMVIRDAIFLKISELFFNRSYKHLFREINYVIDNTQL